jgi:hypothetical protein
MFQFCLISFKLQIDRTRKLGAAAVASLPPQRHNISFVSEADISLHDHWLQNLVGDPFNVFSGTPATSGVCRL